MVAAVISRFQKFMGTLRARLSGSLVDVAGEHFTHLSSRAPVPVNDKLHGRLVEAAKHVKQAKGLRLTPESPYLQSLRAAAQDDLIGNRKILENTYRESTRFGATIDDDFAGPVG